MLSDSQIPEVIGAEAFTHNGDRVGTLEKVYVDEATQAPVYATVQTGLTGGRENVVPIHQASFTNGHVAIPYGTTMVTEAPTVDPGQPLDQQVVAATHQHYNLELSDKNPDAGVTVTEFA